MPDKRRERKKQMKLVFPKVTAIYSARKRLWFADEAIFSKKLSDLRVWSHSGPQPPLAHRSQFLFPAQAVLAAINSNGKVMLSKIASGSIKIEHMIDFLKEAGQKVQFNAKTRNRLYLDNLRMHHSPEVRREATQ